MKRRIGRVILYRNKIAATDRRPPVETKTLGRITIHPTRTERESSLFLCKFLFALLFPLFNRSKACYKLHILIGAIKSERMPFECHHIIEDELYSRLDNDSCSLFLNAQFN